jgi:hypothetical protein
VADSRCVCVSLHACILVSRRQAPVVVCQTCLPPALVGRGPRRGRRTLPMLTCRTQVCSVGGGAAAAAAAAAADGRAVVRGSHRRGCRPKAWVRWHMAAAMAVRRAAPHSHMSISLVLGSVWIYMWRHLRRAQQNADSSMLCKDTGGCCCLGFRPQAPAVAGPASLGRG